MIFRLGKNGLLIGVALSILLSGCQIGRSTRFDESSFNNNITALAKNPNQDVSGHDFKTIPRYPKSVRIVYQRRKVGSKITYFCAYRVAADISEVSSFYERGMKNRGWKLKVKNDEFLTMFFVRSRGGGPPLAQLMFQDVASAQTPYGTIVSIVIQQ